MSSDLTSKYVLISRDTANLIRGAFIPDNPRRMRTAHPDVRRAAEEFIAALAPGASSPPAESLTIIADLLATIDQVADKWKLTDHGCTSCVPGLEGDWLCARHRAVSYVDRNTVTKSEGPYGCIHDSSPTTWCGVCYPEKCTATETSKPLYCKCEHTDEAGTMPGEPCPIHPEVKS